MSLPSGRLSARSRHRVQVENEMIKKREREQKHMQTWGGRDQYYKHWEKNNSKFDEWTSPRYYDSNNKLINEIKKEEGKKLQLEERRDKLRRLLGEEQRTHEIEMMVLKNSYKKEARREDIPTEVLKEINLGLKLEEDDRQRHEAELNLYHKWRINNPILREYERKNRTKDLKLSWLDQQIEKRMQKEKEEEECRQILKEREEFLKKQREKDDRIKKEIQEKKSKLKTVLEKQMQEVEKRQEESDRLRRKEEEETRQRLQIADLTDKYREDEKRRLEKEITLYNIKQHKLKLKQKLQNVQENLKNEAKLMAKLKEMDVAEKIEDQLKKQEMKDAIMEFMKIIKEQQELEKIRQKHLEFCFDSEARTVFEKQSEIWRQEELSRSRLLKDVLDTIKIQVERNIAKNKEQQIEIIRDREKLVKEMEEYGKEMEELQRQEEERQQDWKKKLDEDVRVKKAVKKQQENMKLKKLDEDLDRVRKEEERLRREIMNIQKRQLPIRPATSRIFR